MVLSATFLILAGIAVLVGGALLELPIALWVAVAAVFFVAAAVVLYRAFEARKASESTRGV